MICPRLPPLVQSPVPPPSTVTVDALIYYREQEHANLTVPRVEDSAV